MVPMRVKPLDVKASHESARIVGAEVTRRNERVNRTARLLTSAPTGFMAFERFRKEQVNPRVRRP